MIFLASAILRIFALCRASSSDLRLVRLIGLYRDQQDEASRFVRRIERELECLWLFLQENGVAPTNNHAERTLRFAVLWRKRSFGTRVEKGDRFAERILSLRQMCRLHSLTLIGLKLTPSD